MKQDTRRGFLKPAGSTIASVAMLLVLPCFSASSDESATEQPNIIFIMADDHSVNAASCYGSKINKTPNIDRLAKEGMKFSRCFCSNSLCTPSRVQPTSWAIWSPLVEIHSHSQPWPQSYRRPDIIPATLGNAKLAALLIDGEAAIHPFIIGEMACGNLKKCKQIISLLHALPHIDKADDDEVLFFVEKQHGERAPMNEEKSKYYNAGADPCAAPSRMIGR